MCIRDRNKYSFSDRHIGPREHDIKSIMKLVGVKSIDELIDQTIPKHIQLNSKMNLPKPLSENRFIEHMKSLANKNKCYRSYIGMGYYNTILPGVIQRNILENPGWYTSYTPYQAEIAQGRLEALLNFQTMVSDLTSMDLANASLLDEGTAAAEAMTMLYNCRSRNQKKENVKNENHQKHMILVYKELREQSEVNERTKTALSRFLIKPS